MRIHTDKITERDLYEACPQGVLLDQTRHGSRKRDHAFEVRLYVLGRDELHRHYCNGGSVGASQDIAATWDEWGLWMVKLYAIDPDALIGWYQSPRHFMDMTRRHRDYVRMAHKPHTVAYRTHTAPWLETGIEGVA